MSGTACIDNRSPQRLSGVSVSCGQLGVPTPQVPAHRRAQLIKDAGVHASVVLNPATSLHTLEEILPELHMVLLMSVNPGFGGQRFIPSTLHKIRALKQQITEQGLNVAIEVDGGVNASNAREICDAGADVLVAGTAIFGQPDYAEAIRALRG